MKFARNALLVAATSAVRYQSATAFAPSSGIAAKAFGPRVFVPAEQSSTSVAGVRTFLRRTFGSSATTSTAGPDITKDEVRALFSLWNNALATGDSRIVAKRYAKNSVLLPTVSDTPRTDFASIKDYFDGFLLKQPQGTILDGDIRIGDGWAQDMGIYEVRAAQYDLSE